MKHVVSRLVELVNVVLMTAGSFSAAGSAWARLFAWGRNTYGQESICAGMEH